MTKTVVIDDDAHALIIERQNAIKEKYNINLKISYMVSSILKCYIDQMEEILKRDIGGVSNEKKDLMEEKEINT